MRAETLIAHTMLKIRRAERFLRTARDLLWRRPHAKNPYLSSRKYRWTNTAEDECERLRGGELGKWFQLLGAVGMGTGALIMRSE